jgi:hypothetical protein
MQMMQTFYVSFKQNPSDDVVQLYLEIRGAVHSRLPAYMLVSALTDSWLTSSDTADCVTSDRMLPIERIFLRHYTSAGA